MSAIFGPARQLELVVTDFDATLREWTKEHGVGSICFFRAKPVENYRYHGVAAESPIVSVAFGYTGDLQIEIIHQRNDAPSCYLDFLATGRQGMRHVLGFCDSSEDFDARYARILAAGIRPIHEGALGGVRFAYGFDL